MMDIRQRINAHPEIILKVSPQVDISIGGQNFVLEFNNRAAISILKSTGHNLLSGSLNVLDMLKEPSSFSAVMLAGLVKHHPDLTQDWLDDNLSLRHYAYYFTRLSTALEAILPEPDGEQGELPLEVATGDPLPAAVVNGSAMQPLPSKTLE